MSGFRISRDIRPDFSQPLPLPSIEVLHQMFELDPSIPHGLRWKARPREHFRREGVHKYFIGKWAGKPAGSFCRKYFRVSVTFKIDGEWVGLNLHNHRIIWAMTNGEDPGEHIVDHSDRNKKNNVAPNLRLATSSQSSQNRRRRSDNLSGVAGVSYHPGVSKWRARITVERKVIDLGTFADINDAIAARHEAENRYFGEFAPGEAINVFSN